jgi:tetratricopeptide (TPR) repeat protein
MKPARPASDPVAAQLHQMIAEHKKNYSRDGMLQQIMSLGMAHGQYAILDEYLTSFIQLGAQNAGLYNLIATVQERRQHFNKAAENIRQLFGCEGIKTDTMYQMAGRVLPRTGRIDDLEYCCSLLNEAVALYPLNGALVHHLCETYQMLGQHDKAIPLYNDAIKRMPHNHSLYFGLGIVEMTATGITKGVEPYEHRFELDEFKADTPFVPWPQWHGEPLNGKTLFIWAEQGVGDIIMWAGMLPWLQTQGAHITCAVPAKLLAIFKRSFPAITFIEKTLVLPQPILTAAFDYQCPMGNLMDKVLPHYTPSQHPAYLIADADAVAQKRAEYLAHNPKAQKIVGISWYSNAVNGWRRNIPLATLHPLLDDPETVYISLQYNQQLDDVGQYNKPYPATPIHTDFSFIPVDDIDAWATQFAAMDAIVSIQNSAVHLGGALGIPVTLLLSAYGSWHWGNEHTTNLWYDGVTIHRQAPGQTWEALIASVPAMTGAKT